MLYQTLACLTTLLTLSSAIPTAPPDLTKRDTITRVTPVVKLAGSPLNGQLINAAYGGFFIGRKTTIGQCAIFAGCDTYSNITAINFNQEKASGTLDAEIAGKQTVYVAATGQLSYTSPGSPLPQGARGTPFTRFEYFPPNLSAYAAITFSGSSWVACTTPDTGVYQVSAAAVGHKSSCIAFEMEAKESAPQTGQQSTYQYALSAAAGAC